MPRELVVRAKDAPEGPGCYFGRSIQALQIRAVGPAHAGRWADTQQVACIFAQQVEAPEETRQRHVPAM